MLRGDGGSIEAGRKSGEWNSRVRIKAGPLLTLLGNKQHFMMMGTPHTTIVKPLSSVCTPDLQ
jgi:hypothetical protein